MQFSNDILDTFGAPKLSQLTECGCIELPRIPPHLEAAIWNHISGIKLKSQALFHLELALLRRTTAAHEEYQEGCRHLKAYVDALSRNNHQLRSFLAALRHFEQCVSSYWQTEEVFDHWEKHLLNKSGRLDRYKSGDGSVSERICLMNNVSKHFSAEQASKASAPVWITNTGLECVNAAVTFSELREAILSAWQVLDEMVVELPKRARTKADAPTSSEGGGREVMEQARQLTEEERRELAIELPDSAVAPEIEAAWTDEARRRVAEVDSGKVATLSNEDALRIIASDDD